MTTAEESPQKCCASTSRSPDQCMIHSAIGGVITITIHPQSPPVAKWGCRGEQVAIQRLSTQFGEYSAFRIINLRPLGAAGQQNASVIQRHNAGEQFEARRLHSRSG